MSSFVLICLFGLDTSPAWHKSVHDPPISSAVGNHVFCPDLQQNQFKDSLNILNHLPSPIPCSAIWALTIVFQRYCFMSHSVHRFTRGTFQSHFLNTVVDVAADTLYLQQVVFFCKRETLVQFLWSSHLCGGMYVRFWELPCWQQRPVHPASGWPSDSN